MSVRTRRGEDLDSCVRALATVHAADGYPARWPPDPVGWLTPSGLAAAWVVGHAGGIAGHVAMVEGPDDPALAARTGVPADRLASVTRLFVVPSARGRGAGARLLDRVRRCAAQRGLRLVLDVVDDGGPAVAVYERLGWRLVDRRLADWTMPDGRRLPVRIYVAPDRPSAVPSRDPLPHAVPVDDLRGVVVTEIGARSAPRVLHEHRHVDGDASNRAPGAGVSVR